VLADDGAVTTVVDALQRSLADLEEDVDARTLFARRVTEDRPFDTEEVFGFEGWRQWVPGFAESSAKFLGTYAPALWSQFRVADGGWGIDYDPVDGVTIDDEEQVLAGLRALGYETLRCPGLENQYWGPDDDLVARIDSGQWPPRPAQGEAEGRGQAGT
jgi:hypothetical protein